MASDAALRVIINHHSYYVGKNFCLLSTAPLPSVALAMDIKNKDYELEYFSVFLFTPKKAGPIFFSPPPPKKTH